MHYFSDRFPRFPFKRQRQDLPSNSSEDTASVSEAPQKRFKFDYAYSIISAPISSVVSVTKRLMASTPAPNAESDEQHSSKENEENGDVAVSSSTGDTPPTVSKAVMCTQSVQTTPPPLTIEDHRLALKKHVIKRSTLRDVIQLEQREKYRQLLNKYTTSNSLYTTQIPDNIGSITSPLGATPLGASALGASPRDQATRGPAYLTSTPAPCRPLHSSLLTNLSPSSSDSGTGSGSEASGPIYQNKRMIRDSTKKSSWTNPFDSKWLENWHKILSENVSENERKIKETRKGLEDAKQIGKQLQECKEKLVEKSLIDEVSEDEAIGEELESFPPLTTQMMEQVEKALNGGQQLETLVDAFNITLTRKDIQTLKDMTWLNDEVINYYFNMLMERSKKVEPSIHIFNTFFYPRLLKVGHQGLARWTRKVDLFAVDLIMIPIHLGMHWCLAVVDNRNKSITYYDSLLGDNHQCTSAIRDYLASEHLAKKNGPLDIQNWKLIIKKDIPEQLNGCDCGVFACKYAEYVSQDKPFDFDQSDMPYFRRRMIWEMINKTLL